jgi:luciferase family oxidoreductase group 1
MMTALSVLDLSPIVEGGNAAQALHNSRDLAQHAERLGYNRFWLAEHHNMPGIASAATSIAIAHVAAGTQRIRVGAGGIMLPNHAPLVIAEQFGTLDALHPGRIDLGLGRAPGTDALTMRALRRNLAAGGDAFPQDVLELIAYFHPSEGDRVMAVPGAGAAVEVWILGSSTFGARLAAELGLPYAFASHFAPSQLPAAIESYRRYFRPSPQWPRPYLMLGVNAIAADTDAHARWLGSSLQQAFVRLRSGQPGKLPPPIEGFEERLGPMERAVLDEVLACSFIGAPATIERGLRGLLARTGADELIVSAHIYDHAARVRSYELVAEVGRELARS